MVMHGPYSTTARRIALGVAARARDAMFAFRERTTCAVWPG